jgi:hypothetical protein
MSTSEKKAAMRWFLTNYAAWLTFESHKMYKVFLMIAVSSCSYPIINDY